MDRMKPWQIGLFIVAAVVLGGSLAFNVLGRGGPDLKSHHVLIDVTNGDRFTFNTGGRRGMALPEKNPDSGEYALLPIVERDEGWVIVPRALGMLEDMKFSESVVNAQTGAVEFSDNAPRRLRP
ncbi:MAG: hypothetical protein R3B57_10640 [Phycisphaerales bacterium]